MQLIIKTKLFNFTQNLKFLGRSKHECVHNVENGILSKAIEYKNELHLIQISENEDGLNISFSGNTSNSGLENFTHEFISGWFDLDFDLENFYRFASRDPILAPLAEKFYGLRLVGITDFYESLIWSITGQQINLNFAYILKQKFVETFGNYLLNDGRKYYIFPHPERVIGADITHLLEMKFSRNKAQYIINITQMVANGDLDPTKIEGMDYTEAKAALMKIKGIGNWTADYVLMKYFRYPEALPVGDAGLNIALRKMYPSNAKLSLREMQDLTKHWGQHSAYATFYLWRSLYA